MKSNLNICVLVFSFAIFSQTFGLENLNRDKIEKRVSTRDALYTVAGEEIRGELISISSDSVEFAVPETVFILPRSEVYQINLGMRRPGDWWQTEEDIDDTLLKRIINEYSPGSPGLEKLIEDYPGASYVTLFESYRIVARIDGSLEKTHRYINLALGERCKDIISLSEQFYFPDAGNADVGFARSYNPGSDAEPGYLKHLDDAAIERGQVNGNSPDYDRLWILKAALGEIVVGSIVDFEEFATRKYNGGLDPGALNIAFRDEEPILRERVELRAQAGLAMSFKELNWMSGWQKPTVKDDGDFTVFTWDIKNIPPIIAESYMPPEPLYMPIVTMSVGFGWDSIAAEFTRKLIEADDSPDGIEAIIKEVGKYRSERELASFLYSRVVEDIRLEDVEPSEYFFAPHKISKIIESNAANSLDRAFVFFALAKSAGLNASFGFAARHDSPFDEKIPTLSSIPTPVVKTVLDGDTIFAEFTSEYRPLGVLPQDIVGERAVFLAECANGKITKRLEMAIIPLPTPYKEKIENILTAKIKKKNDGFILEATVTTFYYGTTQEEIRALSQISRDELKTELENRALEIHPNAVLKKFQISGIGDLNSTPMIKMELEVENFGFAAGELFAFNLPGLDYSSNGSGATNREWQFWFDSPAKSSHKIEIELPKGFDVYFVPGNEKTGIDSLHYFAIYRVEKNKLVFDDGYDRSGLLFQPTEYADFQRLKLMESSVAQNWIVLKKK